MEYETFCVFFRLYSNPKQVRKKLSLCSPLAVDAVGGSKVTLHPRWPLQVSHGILLAPLGSPGRDTLDALAVSSLSNSTTMSSLVLGSSHLFL